MPSKIINAILFFVIFFASAILDSSYYSYSSDSEETIIKDHQQDKKEFLDFSIEKKKLPRMDEEVSLIAVGDISYSRGVERIIRKQGDINYPFLRIGGYLEGADLVFGNLETPITKGREILDNEMVFRSNPDTEKALKKIGFSILSLANNHTLNFGGHGIQDTLNYLENADIKYVGAGKSEQEANQPVYVEKNGIKFAFLAYGDQNVMPNYYEAGINRVGIAFMKIERMSEFVKMAKQKADVVIVSMHSGIEYADKPNDFQINFAHAAIDAGADLIIGHHPHVVQTMEEYKGKYIFYSLGNFVFDQMWSQKTKEGLSIKLYFTKNGVSKILFFPVVIENFSQPRLANYDEAKNILQRLEFPLTDRIVYYWDDGINNFEKIYRAGIYDGISKGKAIVFKKDQADLNNNSIKETYDLESGQLTIAENAKIIWQSPVYWWIDNFVIADSNNDRISDINLSVWKAGNFGSSKPFWDKENEMSVKNHLFIFNFAGDEIRPIWQSSNLSAPNCEFAIIDIDGDEKNDLVVSEGDYSQKPICDGNYVAVWKWNGWGFSNEWRSEKGEFDNLEIESIDKNKYF